MDRYKRIDEVVELKDVNDWLEINTVDCKIIYYKEVPAHKPNFIRIQVLLERNEEQIKGKKKRLFS